MANYGPADLSITYDGTNITAFVMTINDFTVGRQIIFPTEDDIAGSVHVVDRDTARLFYECKEYYRAFEQEFNATTRTIMTEWKPEK